MTIHYTLPNDAGISVELTPARMEDGRTYYIYKMTLDGSVLFAGDDYSPSPLDRTPEQIALGLLVFLTVRPGDVDEDYFSVYSPAQMDWARSYRCECAQWAVQELLDAAYSR